MRFWLFYLACALIVASPPFVARGEPVRRSPVLLVGDSMMKLPGLTIKRRLSRVDGIESHCFSGIGTGLSRLDAFDWLAKFEQLCRDHRPKVAVVAVGANDRQPIQLADGTIAQPASPAWDAEYRNRQGKAMDVLLKGGCEQVIWLLLPPMRDAENDRFVAHVNALATAEAQARKEVVLFDVGAVVKDPRTGGFTERLMDRATAETVRVRDGDGIHLTPQGSQLLADVLIARFWP